MEAEDIRDILRLVNNSTSNSLNPQVREVYYAERKRLVKMLTTELDTLAEPSGKVADAPPR
jgi:hypothetical protein